MKILVTGGAGYVGSVVTETLIDEGHDVVVVDSLVSGHRAAVHPAAAFYPLDLRAEKELEQVVWEHGIEAVCHLAAEALIDESITNPGRFYRANVSAGIALLDVMVRAGVKKLVFSSTAAVYGEPQGVPIPEGHQLRPVNCYGDTKLAFERALRWYGEAHAIRHVSFRYFNACGATACYGEDHRPETHLIPRALRVASGAEPVFHVYGADYETPDGTCIRDFVHVLDIAEAHVRALQTLDSLPPTAMNLGSEMGFSVVEVLQAVERVVGSPVRITMAERRAGDPARLVAGNAKAHELLQWEPRRSSLELIIKSAWEWMQTHPAGYGKPA